MYSDQQEEYLTSEFNHTHAGMNELILAEKHNLDIVDNGEPKPLDGYFWDWWAEGLSEKHLWLHNELERLFIGGFKGGIDMFFELAPFMAKMSQLDADVSFCGPTAEFTFRGAKIILTQKCRYKVHA